MEALDSWIASLGLREAAGDDIRGSADTLQDLVEAAPEELEACFGHWKSLPKARFFRDIVKLSEDLLLGGVPGGALFTPLVSAPVSPWAPSRLPSSSPPKVSLPTPSPGEKRPPPAGPPRRNAPPDPDAPPAHRLLATDSQAREAQPPKKKAKARRATAGSSLAANRRKARCTEISRRVRSQLKYDSAARLAFTQPNPKRKLTSDHGRRAAARYASYSSATTVGEFFHRNGRTADLEYDIQCGHCVVLGGWLDAPDVGGDADEAWTDRYDEIVWVQLNGYPPWPAMVLDPREAAEPHRGRAARFRGSMHLLLNFQTKEKEMFSYAASEQLTPWAEGVRRGYHETVWTGKHASYFETAVREATAAVRDAAALEPPAVVATQGG